ncbi:hypothetical protein B0H14DRAFT_3439694 [Mycena olivaceomarginata]|nr:hypothetical protein B0H14DRAFT_3439694 [Mycena olivaceomarginata]
MASTEKPTATEKGKNKTKKKGENTRKVGNPRNFHGVQLEFLEEQLPIYLSKKGRGEVTEYFGKMLGLWWAKFPWYEGYGLDGKLLLKEKVVGSGSGSVHASGNADGSSADASLGVGNWAATGGVNPVFKEKIREEVITRPGTAPWKLPLYKFYMQHPDYVEVVEKHFKKKWPVANLEQKFVLDFRCKCAKDLLVEEDEVTRQELTTEQEEEHQEVLAKHNVHAEKVSEPDEHDTEKREACRMNLAQVVQPFLDSIAKLTGLHVSLLAGCVPPPGSDRFTITLLHSGRTLDIGDSPGYKFHEWDLEGYKKNVMVHWMRFLAETAEHWYFDWE